VYGRENQLCFSHVKCVEIVPEDGKIVLKGQYLGDKTKGYFRLIIWLRDYPYITFMQVPDFIDHETRNTFFTEISNFLVSPVIFSESNGMIETKFRFKDLLMNLIINLGILHSD